MRVPGSELDLRLVGYFTVVAEQGNFGRAAAELRVAQPSLSRQIQRLEEHLGVRLLDRTPSGSSLTDAGRAFLPQARELLDAAHRATAAARAAAAPRELTIGYLPNLVITPAVQSLRRRHPDARIRTRSLRCNDARALLERRVDMMVLHTPVPFATDHLRITELYAERRVAVLPAGHRLAGRESITVADLGGEAFPTCAAANPEWNVFARLEPRPDGNPVLDAPPVYESFEDTLELVATGDAVMVVPAGDRRPAAHPHLVTVPVADAEPTHVVVASRAADTNPLLAAFLTAAAATLDATAPVPPPAAPAPLPAASVAPPAAPAPLPAASAPQPTAPAPPPTGRATGRSVGEAGSGATHRRPAPNDGPSTPAARSSPRRRTARSAPR